MSHAGSKSITRCHRSLLAAQHLLLLLHHLFFRPSLTLVSPDHPVLSFCSMKANEEHQPFAAAAFLRNNNKKETSCLRYSERTSIRNACWTHCQLPLTLSSRCVTGMKLNKQMTSQRKKANEQRQQQWQEKAQNNTYFSLSLSLSLIHTFFLSLRLWSRFPERTIILCIWPDFDSQRVRFRLCSSHWNSVHISSFSSLSLSLSRRETDMCNLYTLPFSCWITNHAATDKRSNRRQQQGKEWGGDIKRQRRGGEEGEQRSCYSMELVATSAARIRL